MSVIEVRHFPPKWDLSMIVRKLATVIRGNFSALNFATSKEGRACYLKLSEILNPHTVVNRLNRATFGCYRINARIPEAVPQLKVSKKPRTIPPKLKHRLNIPIEGSPIEVLENTIKEVISEYNHKFPGAFVMNKKLGKKLILGMRKIIAQRLERIMESDDETRGSCFKLSLAYRKRHPHFTDFEFIKSTLHSIQDASGMPRDEINELEISTVTKNTNVPELLRCKNINVVVHKYGELLKAKVGEHLNNLDTVALETDSEEVKSRKRVRRQLKSMAPCINLIMKEILEKKFLSVRNQLVRIKIYGEPFLPSKEDLMPLTRRLQAVRVRRSRVLYNLLLLSVPRQHAAAALAADGTALNGAKLVVRQMDTNERKKLKRYGKLPEGWTPGCDDSEDSEEEDDSEGSEEDMDLDEE